MNADYKLNVINDIQSTDNKDAYGNTPLLKACYFGDVEAVQFLLSTKANLHAINYFGQNALTLATYAGSFEIVCQLLKHRTYHDFVSSSIIPPTCVAALKNHRDLVNYFNKFDDKNDHKTVHGLTTQDLLDLNNRKRT